MAYMNNVMLVTDGILAQRENWEDLEEIENTWLKTPDLKHAFIMYFEHSYIAL